MRTHRRTRQRRPITAGTIIVNAIIDITLIAAISLGGFFPWYFFIHEAGIANEQQTIANTQQSEWGTPSADETDADPQPSTDPAPVLKPTSGIFATVEIPRLGKGWSRAIGAGISDYNLNKVGAAYYSETQGLGEAGNFAIASHRGGFGSSLKEAPQLRPGDNIWIETEAGWYQYTYRSQEYVLASQVEVLNPVPNTDTPVSALDASDSILTITTCNPYPATNGERLITYADYEAFYPRDGGTPKELRS